VILVDTGPLVALCDPRDGLNPTALHDLDRAFRDPLILCAPVLTEACFLLPHAVQRRRLQRMLDQLSVRAYQADDEGRLWGEVFHWLDQYQEHRPDWTDGYLAVLSGKDRRLRVWTYDREFRTKWRRPDGTTIPLFARRA
jgi:predicted nucleic acid-binding protein